ncbi:helix-turn-helix transcriptional regulator [Erysipelotrichaceae bacterium RD49]|nr:helix-turn-helix transcriptional regulator [Erysipelotrichaceae bacterium RD49]
MELGKQIRKYRMETKLSQEQLAERVFVSRQTISNWENDKNYPDLRSLVLLSEVFQVSLDQLVKGDIEKMKVEIDSQEYTRFQNDSTIFTILFIVLLIVPIPLVRTLKWMGMAAYLTLFGITMYFAVRIERYKKKYDIQTYKEIVAFSNGESLDEIEKAREAGKRPYQKVLLAAGCAAGVVVIALVMDALMRSF